MADPAANRSGLEPVRFDALPGWGADDHAATLAAFCRTAKRHLERPLRSRELTPLDSFDAVARAGLEADDARQFFETHFTPHRIGEGKLTGYYEPEFAGSRERSDAFPVPLHARPPELVNITGGDMRYGVMRDGKLSEYHDRAGIQDGALEGRGLELVWLRDAVDAFVVHIQGCARLRLTDGSTMRVTYAAKSGHAYTSLGAELLRLLREDEPGTKAADVTADVLNDWMRAHPERQAEFLARNRSYIFFEEAADATDGPVAAAKVALTPGRSLAIDRGLHSFGLPFWIDGGTDSDDLLPRLTIAQDTGSAILGAARGDLFIGTGAEAGSIAGRMNRTADFTVLLPNAT